MARPKHDKHEQILAVAGPLFARFGLRKTTIDDIAHAAGLGKGTIYLYFTSKEEIFQAVARGCCEQLMTRMRDELARETTVEGRLRHFIIERFRNVHGMIEELGLTREVFLETRHSPVFQTLHDEMEQQERQMIEEIIAAGVAAGVFRSPNVTFAAMAISSAIQALESPWLCDGRELPLEEKAATLVELFMNGLHGTAGARADDVRRAGAVDARNASDDISPTVRGTAHG